MEKPMRIIRPIAIATLGSLLFLAGCQKEEDKQAAAPAMPPTPVAVVTTKSEEAPIMNELPGRIAATRIAEVRPRISGIIVERVFEQGSIVNEGEVLYRIDPEPFRVQVDSAEGTLRRAKAVQLQAKQAADRQEQLKKSNVASAQQFDDAVAQLAAADADVAIAEAGLATAKLNLEYSEVKAPITGRIGRALITEGALVSSSSSEALATIQQLDPVYADFTQSATDLIRLRKALQDGDLMNDDSADVTLLFDDGTAYGHIGKLLFSEAAVDETTGQVTLRGEFPNPDNDLLPGMYVRVQIQQGIQKSAILVPQQAIQRDTAGQAQLYVVNAENVLEVRRVNVGRAVDQRFIVTSGLQPGEKVVVEGFQKIGPGATVAPADWQPAGQAPAEKPAEAAEAPAAAGEAAEPAAKAN
ncbi:efflux RND transporter periplasmic adaptor subunit [Rhizobium sp. TRM96647]|nr:MULTISPECIES: efflux RND transporter periplasmic adaptor subunit [unclassified Rhizobium]MCV3736688.1 efflux RND transporter periplasmic adaptor subunit [Rhizobium sp. TRM96647]MCV3756912.1 efflux RND transporter periplasmic adaptor subunit [Rhizobium sp. TRM96650]